MSKEELPEIVKELRKEEFQKIMNQKPSSYYFSETETIEKEQENEIKIKGEAGPILSVLKEFEDETKSLVKPSEEIVLQVNKNGDIIDINHAGKQFFKNKGEKFWDLFKQNHDKKPFEIQDIFENIISGDRKNNSFVTELWEENNKLLINFSFYPVYEDNNLTDLIIIGENVSQIKEYEEKLIESGDKFDSLAKYFDMLSDTAIALGKRDLFSNVNDIIFQTDTRGRITFANAAVNKIAGFAPEEIVGKKLFKIIPKRDWKKIYNTFFLEKGKTEVSSFETNIKKKNGTEVPVEINCKLTLHGVELLGKKKKLSIQGSIRDITARKEVELALKESEEKYRTIFENASDVIVYLDRYGNILNINKSIIETFGREKEDLIGKNFTELGMFETKSLPLFTNMMRNVLSGKNYSLFETEIKHGDGSRIPIEVSVCSVKKRGRKEGILCIVRDITERRKADEERRKNAEKIRNINEELKLTNKELTEAQKELKILNQDLEKKVADRTVEIKKLLQHKIDFIGQLGHDLKSPLTPLVALVPILKDEETDPKRKELLEVVERNLDYMRELVIKTLKFERLNSPNFKLNLEEICLFESVDRIIKNKKYIFDEKELKIENNVDKNITVNVDRIEFTELIDNLLTNATKYTNSNGKIVIGSEKGKDFVKVSVKDTGIGLTEEQMEHIFDEFYKTDDSRHELESSGLGLSICKRIVEKHNGRIWAESKGIDKGSTFYFTLPL